MLKIVGDICFADGYFDAGMGIGTAIKSGANPFCHLQRNPDDYWIGNFESVCADDSSIKGSFFIHSAAMKNVRHLNLYGVANNHVMQHGEAAYYGLLSYLDSKGIAYAGAKGKRIHRFVHQEKVVGMLAFCQRPDNFSITPPYWHLPEYKDIIREVDSLSDCDYRIAYIHWGNEFINYPYTDQKQFAHFLADCGIDLIVGMHPHVMQGCEHYNGCDIYYSLGNVFNMPWLPTKYGLMLTVDLASKFVTADYLKIGNDCFPAVVQNVPEQFSLEYLNSLLVINKENEHYYRTVFDCYHKYRTVNRKAISKRFIRLSNKEKVALVKDFFQRRILKPFF